MEFDWDEINAIGNLRKHRVGFAEASTVFDDPHSTTFADPDHSIGEDRYVTIGTSNRGRLLVISFTERGDVVRIINARKATPRERTSYEENP
jgi:uncharacterized DUF497 family protein